MDHKRHRELVKLRTMALDLARLADGLLAENETQAPAPDAWIRIDATGLPPKTARRLLKTGELEGRRVGRAYLVSRASVDAYMRRTAPVEGEDPLAAELGIVPRGKLSA
jgi:excisionase family DNA binding protein